MQALATTLARSINRRLGGRHKPLAGAAALRLEQVLPLDPRRRLLVVQCGSRRLLLLTGGPADLSLGWLPDEPAEGCAP